MDKPPRCSFGQLNNAPGICDHVTLDHQSRCDYAFGRLRRHIRMPRRPKLHPSTHVSFDTNTTGGHVDIQSSNTKFLVTKILGMVRIRYTIVISTMQNMVTVITIAFWFGGSSSIGTTPSGGSSAGPLRLSSLCSGRSKEKSMNEIQPQMNFPKFYRRCGKRGRSMTEIRGKAMLGDRYPSYLGTVIF